MEMVAGKYGLWPHLRLKTHVKAAQWDEVAAEWTLTTASGDEIIANAVISAQGMFNELNWPSIEGLDGFQGVMFHSARWDGDHSRKTSASPLSAVPPAPYSLCRRSHQ